jgi:hypothetical protein
MSALAYRMSTILIHGGVSYLQDTVTIHVLLEHLVHALNTVPPSSLTVLNIDITVA